MVKKILIIDDHAVIRFTLTSCLEGLGDFELFEADDGQSARTLFASHEFDLVFCDINMPNENGIDVLQYLAELKFRGAIVLISSTDEALLKASSLLAKQFNLVILGVAEKPIKKTTVSAFLQRAVNRFAPLSRADYPPLSLSQIELALDQRRVVAYFQPQILLATQQLSGFEALARIETDTGEQIAPARFIDVAEQSDSVMLALTKAVIKDALLKFSKIYEQNSQLTLSVNISARVLIEQDFPHWLKQCCQQHSVPTYQVICELTETALASHPSLLTASLLRLRLFQFQLSIDDFGTGYASIEQLHALPFQELKIDQCFIFECLTDLKSKVVVEQTIKLAKGMGVKVVAEGVETADIASFLSTLDCDIGQGYLYAKPLSFSQIFGSEGLFEYRIIGGEFP